MATLSVNQDALQRLRGDQTWSAFADQIGIDAGTLSRIRNGESQPGPKFIANVVAAYPVRIQDIITVVAA
ncbi:MAG: helix-turn-helix domain-containing protein [Actinomycetota bacterium]|nr:helix-turn-helix domain-containing protein [Actinomycetota bacterium]